MTIKQHGGIFGRNPTFNDVEVEGSLTSASADINGGAIDGTVIGGASAAAGTFTTIAGTGLNVDASSPDVVIKDTQTHTTTDGPLIQFQGRGPNAINYNFGYIQGLSNGSNNAGDVVIGTNTGGVQYQRMRIASNGDISFYEDTGTTPKMVWKSADERLGIGTSSPAAKVDSTVDGNVIGTKINLSATSSDTEIIPTSYPHLELARASSFNGSFIKFSNNRAGFAGIGSTASSDNTHYLSMYTGSGTERMRILSNGDFQLYEDTGTTPKLFWDASAESLGIGTTSPNSSAGLHLYHATTNVMTLFESGDPDVYVAFKDDTTSGDFYNRVGAVGDNLYFYTNNTERMRIDSSGNVLIGTTSSTLAQNNNSISLIGGSTSAFRTTSAGPIKLIAFQSQGGEKGSISVTTAATAYNTSSDYRLKEDWVPMEQSIERVKALKPVNFAWKVDGSRVDGFLAHEAQEVVPEAITGAKDAVDKDGKPEYQGIDQSKLVPLLTAALQEAIGRIETLEAEVAALKGA